MRAIKLIGPLLFLFAGQKSIADFLFYYGDEPRTLEVNAFDKTILVFPSPPYTQICQPSGVVALDTLASRNEIQEVLPSASALSLIDRYGKPTGEDGPLQGQEAETDGRDSLVASLLKLTPLRQQGETTCAIKLVNGETAMLTFSLSDTVQRPTIELQNISKATTPAKVSTKLGGLNVFRDLVSGGNLTYLVDISPGSKKAHRTANARYRLSYLGSDSDNFRAWRFSGNAHKDFSAPLFLPSKMGQILFSAWRSKNVEEPRKLGAGDHFELYILTSADVSYTELTSKLP